MFRVRCACGVVDLEMAVGDAYTWCILPSVIRIREYQNCTAYPVRKSGLEPIHDEPEDTKFVACVVVKQWCNLDKRAMLALGIAQRTDFLERKGEKCSAARGVTA